MFSPHSHIHSLGTLDDGPGGFSHRSRVVDDLLWDLGLNARCSTVVSHLKNPSMCCNGIAWNVTGQLSSTLDECGCRIDMMTHGFGTMSSGCAKTSDVAVDAFATSEIPLSPCRSALNGLRDRRRAEFQLDRHIRI